MVEITMLISIPNPMPIAELNTMQYLFQRYITENMLEYIPDSDSAILCNTTTITIDNCKSTS